MQADMSAADPEAGSDGLATEPSAAGEQTAWLIVKFKVAGQIRFLSHSEMLRVFQRAIARAGVPVVYTRGFNPRPRFSLPLPRSVGVASDDELLAVNVRMRGFTQGVELEQLRENLAKQLPQGCAVLSVDLGPKNTCFQTCVVTYLVRPVPESAGGRLCEKMRAAIDSEHIVVERRVGAEGSKVKCVNVRAFIESIQTRDGTVTVACRSGPSGSIRVEEILDILGLDYQKIAAPVRRARVEWQI
jgi:radical SAM-linked protein